MDDFDIRDEIFKMCQWVNMAAEVDWIWQWRAVSDSGGRVTLLLPLQASHPSHACALDCFPLGFDTDTKKRYTVFTIFTTLDIWQYIYNISKYHKISQNTSNCVPVVPFFMNQSGNASLMSLHWSDLNLRRMMLPRWTCWVGWRLEWTGRAFKQWDEPELGAHL